MAMKKRFYSVNGQMMGYESGGEKKDFLTDHLGSIIAEVDQTQARTYESRYSAYGRNNWSTGTGCGFGWVGFYGYRETGTFFNSHYVRARHYSYVSGLWNTVDPLWPDESAFGYVGGRATFGIDPTGYSPLQDCKKGKSRQACFQCAYKHLQVNNRVGPLGACEAANKLCGSHIVCGSCGPCPEPAAPGCTSGGIQDFGEFLRGSSSSSGKAGIDCSGSCGGYGVGDKLAHCVKGCYIALCTLSWFLCFLGDKHEDDRIAEDIGAGIGNWIFDPRDCLSRCAQATKGMEMY
jgi:hypothetical protein